MAASNPRGVRTEQESEGSTQSTTDITAFVQNLLAQLQTRFEAMSKNIVSKIEEMGSRIDELEQSINDLKAEMGAEGAVKPKPKEPRPPKKSKKSAEAKNKQLSPY